MTAPLFIDREKVAAMHVEFRRRQRDQFVADGVNANIIEAWERAEPIHRAFYDWLVDEMARGTHPLVDLEAFLFLAWDMASTIGSSALYTESFIQKLWCGHAEQWGNVDKIEVAGTQGGRA